DAAINVSQQFLSPFGATPNNLGNVTNNRYTARDYTISPYIRGRTAQNAEYELRDTMNWSNASQIETQGVGQTGNSNEIRGFVGRNAGANGRSVRQQPNA